MVIFSCSWLEYIFIVAPVSRSKTALPLLETVLVGMGIHPGGGRLAGAAQMSHN
jgi:hypothetical protein